MKASDTTFTILQLALMDETGDSYYRMRWPAAELAQQAPGWRVLNLDSRSEDRYRWALEADLFIAYQSSDIDLLPIIRRRRELGKKTLVEYNDNFYAPPAASPVVREWSSPLLWQTYERFMELADGIIVTGPGLEKLFKGRFGKKPVHVLQLGSSIRSIFNMVLIAVVEAQMKSTPGSKDAKSTDWGNFKKTAHQF